MEQKIYNIISYGESMQYWLNYPKDDFPNFASIGVNDVGKFTDLDYLLLVDEPDGFKPYRMDAVRRTLPLSYFIVSLNWMKFLDRCVPITLCKERRNLKTLDDPLLFANMPFSYNSPFIAAILAYRMGAKVINLFGVDFNTDSSPEHRDKNIEDWRDLYQALSNRGIKIYTCPGSQLESFIPINPNLSY